MRDFGRVEVIARNRYALFRTTRIFADLTVTRDALRIVVHLARRKTAPIFVKDGVAEGSKRVSHVAFIRCAEDLNALLPFLGEAFDLAGAEDRRAMTGKTS